jgi:hypothetical protein
VPIDSATIERLRARDTAPSRGDTIARPGERRATPPPTARDSFVTDTTRPPPRVLGRPVGEAPPDE